MKSRYVLASILTAVTLGTVATGCSVARHQESTGAYVDDTVITSRVKAKFAADKNVSANAISVETMKGVVQLSGFAKSTEEKSQAELLARSVNGVQDVRNDIIVKSS
jgi:osmotically-inducible protein OsmY